MLENITFYHFIIPFEKVDVYRLPYGKPELEGKGEPALAWITPQGVNPHNRVFLCFPFTLSPNQEDS